MTVEAEVHLLARRSAHPTHGGQQLWARCGLIAAIRFGERLPASFTGAAGNVTCPRCADPPSWADAGIPG